MLFAVCKKTKPELKPIGIVSQDIIYICRFWKQIKSQTSKMVRISLAWITQLPSCYSSYSYWGALYPPKLEAGRLCMLRASLFCILLSWIQESSHQCHFPVADHFLTRLLHILNHSAGWRKRVAWRLISFFTFAYIYKFLHIFFPNGFFSKFSPNRLLQQIQE